jgi:hypothetical protein
MYRCKGLEEGLSFETSTNSRLTARSHWARLALAGAQAMWKASRRGLDRASESGPPISLEAREMRQNDTTSSVDLHNNA